MHGGNVFTVAREQGWDWRDVLDFSASINPLGPAAGVWPAIRDGLERIVHYPEREAVRLQRALGELWGVGEDQVLPGNGATELIFFLGRVLGDVPVRLGTPVFGEFCRAFPRGVVGPVNEDIGSVTVVTRPANPTGCCVGLELIERLLERGQVIVDESFLEFSGQPSAISLLERYSRLMVLRSLTKFYALPGLRIGALVSSAENVRGWRQQREPWQVNVLAEEAALAAIADTEHAARSVEFVRSERGWLFEQLRGMAAPEPGEANFLYVRVAGAAALCEHLLRRKILIRNCTDWPGLAGEAVRVAVRRRDENERLLEAWREFTCD